MRTLARVGLLATTLLPALVLLAPGTVCAAEGSAIDAGDTAWVLVSSALVLLMTPGLALFYAGMVRAKNALSSLMHSSSLVVLRLNSGSKSLNW